MIESQFCYDTKLKLGKEQKLTLKNKKIVTMVSDHFEKSLGISIPRKVESPFIPRKELLLSRKFW